MIRIDGSYLEGGGQILRSSLALSTILNKEVNIFNIRKNRNNPGLREQHLKVIEAFKEIFNCSCKGDYLGSNEILFYPSKEIKKNCINIKPKTSASIGLILQAVLPAIYFLDKKLVLEISGGTAGKWSIPVNFYPYIIFPILGIDADFEIKKYGYYPKGGGLVVIKFKNFLYKKIELIERKKLEKIKILSFASEDLKIKKVAERQTELAKNILEERLKDVDFDIDIYYFKTLSSGFELDLCAYFSGGVRLWADALGEKYKTFEDVAKEASLKLLREIDSNSCCDLHLADNLILYLAFLKGRIKTSQITNHTLTNIWVCENFLDKIFKIKDNFIEVDAFSTNPLS